MIGGGRIWGLPSVMKWDWKQTTKAVNLLHVSSFPERICVNLINFLLSSFWSGEESLDLLLSSFLSKKSREVEGLGDWDLGEGIPWIPSLELNWSLILDFTGFFPGDRDLSLEFALALFLGGLSLLGGDSSGHRAGTVCSQSLVGKDWIESRGAGSGHDDL